jgi:hypothetical protein
MKYSPFRIRVSYTVIFNFLSRTERVFYIIRGKDRKYNNSKNLYQNMLDIVHCMKYTYINGHKDPRLFRKSTQIQSSGEWLPLAAVSFI